MSSLPRDRRPQSADRNYDTYAISLSPSGNSICFVGFIRPIHSIWPFKKRTVATLKAAPAEAISYSQLDITERFEDNLGFTTGDWISTVPLNEMTSNAQAMGLPSVQASEEAVY